MRALWFISAVALIGCGGDDDDASGSPDTDVLLVDSATDVVSSDVVDSAKADSSVSDTALDTASDVLADDASTDGDARSSDTDGGCPSAWTVAPTVDSTIALPADGGSLLLHAAGSGTQNYTCVATAVSTDAGADADAADSGDGGDAATTTYAWTLTAPEAELKDCAAVKIGTHFASAAGAAAPEWMTTDGTFVIGSKKSAYTADATAIPWLLVQATSHGGTGTLSKVQYIQRVNTTAGKAPATGCDATSVGATTKIAYTADYYFFGTP